MKKRKKIILIGVLTTGLIVLGWQIFQYTGINQAAVEPGTLVRMNELNTNKESRNPEEGTLPARTEWRLEEAVSGLAVPWSIVWTSPERMLVTERPGRIRVVENDVLLPKSLHVFDDVSSNAEEGLMGLVVDPDYDQNRYIYVSYAYRFGSAYRVRVARFRDEGDRLTDEAILLDDIPAARFHAGARLKFGPDGKLYLTTGDATDADIAQDLDSLGGKILRLNPDGSIPDDNPFPDSYVWSYGHRNAQGIDWHPISGELYSTEHGPSVFDGPAGGDEINHVRPGENYGWPLVSHTESTPEAKDPILVFTPAEAPASGVFYASDTIPQWENDFFFGALRGEGIIRVRISPADPEQVAEYEKLDIGDLGRIRDVALGPDGYLYFSTSNRDGRGKADARDDRIFRIIPN